MARDKFRYGFYSSKDNTVYILSRCMLPDTNGLSWKEHCAAYEKAFAMPYPERIRKYAPEWIAKEIESFIAEHDGAKISEYTVGF